MVVSAWIGSVAKALVAFAIVCVVSLLTDKGLVVDNNVVDAILTGLGVSFPVWAVPNRPYNNGA